MHKILKFPFNYQTLTNYSFWTETGFAWEEFKASFTQGILTTQSHFNDTNSETNTLK